MTHKELIAALEAAEAVESEIQTYLSEIFYTGADTYKQSRSRSIAIRNRLAALKAQSLNT